MTQAQRFRSAALGRGPRARSPRASRAAAAGAAVCAALLVAACTGPASAESKPAPPAPGPPAARGAAARPAAPMAPGAATTAAADAAKAEEGAPPADGMDRPEAKGGMTGTPPEEVTDTEEAKRKDEYQVPLPPFSEGVYPCSGCHKDMKPNDKRRKLTEPHEKIALRHGPRERWCFDCHNPENRDKLRLASGSLVSFERSYLLCGQCHGPKLREWRAGIHGKRTGSWNGRKQYLLCAHCHDPHKPRYRRRKPCVPPVAPGDLRGTSYTEKKSPCPDPL